MGDFFPGCLVLSISKIIWQLKRLTGNREGEEIKPKILWCYIFTSVYMSNFHTDEGKLLTDTGACSDKNVPTDKQLRTATSFSSGKQNTYIANVQCKCIL